jgi:hypothetical protein
MLTSSRPGGDVNSASFPKQAKGQKTTVTARSIVALSAIRH